MAECKDYLDLLQKVVDNESTEGQEVYLRRHLKMCLKCLDKLNLDQELKKAIKDKLTRDEVPADLAATIREQISKSA